MVLNRYKVTIEFFVDAEDDDAALHKVTKILSKYWLSYGWAWVSTQLQNKGETNANTNK